MKNLLQKVFPMLACALCIGSSAFAQTDTVYSMPPLTATTTGLANFTFEVSSTSAIVIKRMATAFSTAGNIDVWYRPGGVQHIAGQAPVITTTNGWIQAATVAMPTSTTPVMIPYLFNIPVNPGTPVGIYFGGSLRYNSTTGPPDIFTDIFIYTCIHELCIILTYIILHTKVTGCLFVLLFTKISLQPEQWLYFFQDILISVQVMFSDFWLGDIGCVNSI